MKKLLKISALALFVAVGAFAFATLNPSVAVAQDAEQPAENQEQQAEEQKDEESKTPYSYTAQAGDSYTKIARKAVQTYGINNNVNLSGAQIVAAETFLTSDAKFPTLNVGEKVELTNDAVKAAVDKAQGLDDAAKARWEKFVKFVNFDTNKVGQA